MTAWAIALAIGTAFAALQYARAVRSQGAWALLPAALRAAAVTLLIALLLDAHAGRVVSPPPIVALDASLSWQRGDTSRWNRALERARALGADSLLLTGDSVRLAAAAPEARDTRSSIAAVAEQAKSQGRPLIVITDGELPPADAADIGALPRGSRLEVLPPPATVDAGIAALAVPRSIDGGDTLRGSVTVVGGAAPVPATAVTLRLDAILLATLPLAALAPHATREVPFAVRLTGREGEHVLRAILVGTDAEPRNDTVGVAIDISVSTAAVWISSAPDLDGRAALSVLRGSLAVPTRGFLRVAPGSWRVEGTLAPVSESIVRDAAASASMLVIHGDTAVFGPPRALAGNAPLALLPGPGREEARGSAAVLDEWYPSGAPASPAAAALAGVAWDSLPPVSLGASAGLAAPAPSRSWIAVEGRRSRRGDASPIVVGTELPRRVVVTRATGMWRWQARGGAGATAYQGLWGSLFDWMADARRDRRAAVPELGSVREGEPITWRISVGVGADSAVRVVLVPRGDATGGRTLMLEPRSRSTFAESPPLAAGVYDAVSEGGHSVVVVNAAAELLPAAPTVHGGEHGSGVVAGSAPALRDFGLAYAAIVLLLCAEWALRRGRGLA